MNSGWVYSHRYTWILLWRCGCECKILCLHAYLAYTTYIPAPIESHYTQHTTPLPLLLAMCMCTTCSKRIHDAIWFPLISPNFCFNVHTYLEIVCIMLGICSIATCRHLYSETMNIKMELNIFDQSKDKLGLLKKETWVYNNLSHFFFKIQKRV